jgi:hypothetical protein
LTLNAAKTSVKDAQRRGFDFLGYTLDRATFLACDWAAMSPVSIIRPRPKHPRRSVR